MYHKKQGSKKLLPTQIFANRADNSPSSSANNNNNNNADVQTSSQSTNNTDKVYYMPIELDINKPITSFGIFSHVRDHEIYTSLKDASRHFDSFLSLTEGRERRVAKISIPAHLLDKLVVSEKAADDEYFEEIYNLRDKENIVIIETMDMSEAKICSIERDVLKQLLDKHLDHDGISINTSKDSIFAFNKNTPAFLSAIVKFINGLPKDKKEEIVVAIGNKLYEQLNEVRAQRPISYDGGITTHIRALRL